jgi:hypothetical protein
LVLYRYDFQDPQLESDPAHLIPRGQLRLFKMATLLEGCVLPVVIEPTGDPILDNARRQYVIGELAKALPEEVAAQRVVVALPAARGLMGVEALDIDRNLMQQTANRGLSSTAATPGRVLSPVQTAPVNAATTSR